MTKRHTGRAAKDRAPRPHIPPMVRPKADHPLTQRIWAHGFTFGGTQLYIGPARENPTLADAIKLPTILGIRERDDEPYKRVADFTSVTAAKEFVQALIRGLEAPGNAAVTVDDGETPVTADLEEAEG